MNTQEVNFFLEKGFLVSPDFSCEGTPDAFLERFTPKITTPLKPLILHKDLLIFLDANIPHPDVNWIEFEKSRAYFEFGKDRKLYDTFLQIFQYNLSAQKKEAADSLLQEVQQPGPLLLEKEEDTGSVIVLQNYQGKSKKREVQDFVKHYNLRFEALKKLLLKRQELQNALSLHRVLAKSEGGGVSFIGMVSSRDYTQKGNLLFTLEDVTGEVKVVVNKNRKELFDLARDVMVDEVIGICGSAKEKIVFCNEILFPDVPLDKELKKADEEVYAAFTADLHVGSYLFFKEDLLKFIDWINGNSGNEAQRAIAQKVKYLFLVGDLVDGVGIYPRQEDELTLKDVYAQYALCASLIQKIRKDVHIIICGGNHDAVRLAEPQPCLDKEFAQPFWEMPNVTLVTNPSLVSIHAKRDFDGLKVLLYHGYSFQYYADNVESIRASGGNYRADLIMRYLLQRRHLAPSHSSTLFVPDTDKDSRVIDDVPDFFVTGHIHRTAALNYRNVTLIGCSCWVGRTSFMEKVGIHPDPSRITLVNLQTREMKILKFGE